MGNLNELLNNPLYSILFGSGGILVILLTLFSFKNKSEKEYKNKKENEIHINIGVNGDSNTKDVNSDGEKNRDYNFEFDINPIIDVQEEYDSLDFNSEDFYVTYLKTIEEKKKAGDKFEYK